MFKPLVILHLALFATACTTPPARVPPAAAPAAAASGGAAFFGKLKDVPAGATSRVQLVVSNP